MKNVKTFSPNQIISSWQWARKSKLQIFLFCCIGFITGLTIFLSSSPNSVPYAINIGMWGICLVMFYSFCLAVRLPSIEKHKTVLYVFCSIGFMGGVAILVYAMLNYKDSNFGSDDLQLSIITKMVGRIAGILIMLAYGLAALFFGSCLFNKVWENYCLRQIRKALKLAKQTQASDNAAANDNNHPADAQD